MADGKLYIFDEAANDDADERLDFTQDRILAVMLHDGVKPKLVAAAMAAAACIAAANAGLYEEMQAYRSLVARGLAAAAMEGVRVGVLRGFEALKDHVP